MITYRDPSSRFAVDAPALAILPLACQVDDLDQPLGASESFLVDAISYRVASAIHQPCFLVPVWPYGTGSTTGGIHLRSDTLRTVVTDMVQSLHNHGITKVAVINSLGSCTEIGALPHGNTVVKTAVRQLNYENPGLTVIWVQPLRAARRRLVQAFGDGLDDQSLKHLLVDALTVHPPDSKDKQKRNSIQGELALEEICQATVDYIETTFSLLDRIKSDHHKDRQFKFLIRGIPRIILYWM